VSICVLQQSPHGEATRGQRLATGRPFVPSALWMKGWQTDAWRCKRRQASQSLILSLMKWEHQVRAVRPVPLAKEQLKHDGKHDRFNTDGDRIH
jgi:hypothetical protein